MKQALYILNFLIFLAIPGALCIYVIDELTTLSGGGSDPGAGEAQAGQEQVPRHAGSGRVFAVLIDSLSDQSARNVSLMPALAGMRPESAYATVQTVFDAVTVPAVRAAFTGTAQFQVFGFVRNFMRISQDIPSLFRQLRERGDQVALFSDAKTFYQFGDKVAEHLYFEGAGMDTISRQNNQLEQAFSLFLKGRHSLVLYHMGYLDYAAHKFGSLSPEYAHQFRMADSIIEQISQRLPAGDTLMVFGDHGHTVDGRHALGLDVPTHILMKGPGFVRGVDLGRLHITTYRYFFSWALKLPLGADHKGGGHVGALKPEGEIPTDFNQVPVDYTLAKDQDSSQILTFFVLVMCMGILAFIWWTVGDMIYHDRLQWPSTLKAWYLPLITLVLFALFYWGRLLGIWRTWIHEPFYPTIYQIWGGALLVMLPLVRRFGPGLLALIMFLVPWILLYPTAYRYGATGVAFPAWFCWAVMAAVAAVRNRAGRESPPLLRVGSLKIKKSLLLAAGVIFLVQPYFFTDASNFEFSGFLALSPEIVPTSIWARSLVGAAAAWLVIYRAGPGILPRAVALTFTLYVLVVYFRMIPEGSLIHAAVAAVAMVAALVTKRRVPVGELHLRRDTLGRSLFFIALYAAAVYLIRTDQETRLNLVLVMAAMRLSTLLVAELSPAHQNPRIHALLFLAFGVVASGWFTLNWNISAVEWSAVYDFFPPKMVEDHVTWFLPVIVLKYAIVVLMFRALVVEGLARLVPDGQVYPDRELALVIAAKYVSLLMICLGLAWFTAGSNVFLEAVGQMGIFVTLIAGLI